MSEAPRNGSHGSPEPSLWTPPPAAALAPLLEAYQCARQLGKDVWEFAVELRCLREAGLTHSQLRWLLAQGWVTQQAECSRPSAKRRAFRRVENLSLGEAGCFVLTERGAGVFSSLRQHHRAASDRPARPCWDALRCELRVGAAIVKHFKQPAPNQQLVLQAFEEEGWPPRIDDPLPPEPDQDAKQRLHSTINNLNRSHKTILMQFCGRGDAQSFGWYFSGPTSASDSTAIPWRV
jgi:hypothetical protein